VQRIESLQKIHIILTCRDDVAQLVAVVEVGPSGVLA